jgi:hypothetical protein
MGVPALTRIGNREASLRAGKRRGDAYQGTCRYFLHFVGLERGGHPVLP